MSFTDIFVDFSHVKQSLRFDYFSELVRFFSELQGVFGSPVPNESASKLNERKYMDTFNINKVCTWCFKDFSLGKYFCQNPIVTLYNIFNKNLCC